MLRCFPSENNKTLKEVLRWGATVTPNRCRIHARQRESNHHLSLICSRLLNLGQKVTDLVDARLLRPPRTLLRHLKPRPTAFACPRSSPCPFLLPIPSVPAPFAFPLIAACLVSAHLTRGLSSPSQPASRLRAPRARAHCTAFDSCRPDTATMLLHELHILLWNSEAFQDCVLLEGDVAITKGLPGAASL